MVLKFDNGLFYTLIDYYTYHLLESEKVYIVVDRKLFFKNNKLLNVNILNLLHSK